MFLSRSKSDPISLAWRLLGWTGGLKYWDVRPLGIRLGGETHGEVDATQSPENYASQ